MPSADPDLGFSDELAAHGAPEHLVEEAKALERIALRRSLQVNSNGRHPKEWTLERWLLVTMTCFSAVGTIIGFAFLFGGNWTSAKSDIEAGKNAVVAIGRKVDLLQTQLDAVSNTQIQGQYKLDNLKLQVDLLQRDGPRIQVGAASPQFGR